MGFVPRDRWSRRGACGSVALQQCRDVGQEAGAARPAVPLSPPRCRCRPRCAQVYRLHDGPCLAEGGGVRRGAAGVERERRGWGEGGVDLPRELAVAEESRRSASRRGVGGGDGGGRRRRRGGGGREQERGGDRGNRVEGEGVIAKMVCGVFFIKTTRFSSFFFFVLK